MSNSTYSTEATEMMALALRLALRGEYTARPNPMVGCVIVNQGEIVGEGWHQQYGKAHAEINALAQAGNKAKGATCYVTLEPCSHQGKTGPCVDALIAAKISKVVMAMRDPNPKVAGDGLSKLIEAGIEVSEGLLQPQALSLNRGFFKRMTSGRPFVSCKLAMSVDGRTALADGTSQWITGSAARIDVHKLRARQDAIITGIGTLLADDPSLTVRADVAGDPQEANNWLQQAEAFGFRQPTRILCDASAKAPPSAKIFANNSAVWWLVDDNSQQGLQSAGSHVSIRPHSTDLNLLLSQCADAEMNHVMVEAGHKLAGAFLTQRLVDELIIYMAPKLMGNKGLGMFNFNPLAMKDCPSLKLINLTQIGDDIKLVYQVYPDNANEAVQ